MSRISGNDPIRRAWLASLTHKCQGDLPKDKYEPALDACYERNGELWVEYTNHASRVNYCPYCGYKAKKQVGT